MKAAVLHAFDEKLTAKEFVKYEDVTDPKISRPMDVIVRIGGAGVCRTDLHIVEGIWRSKVDVKLPYIMGHENAGWVEAIGPGVEGVKVGDSVTFAKTVGETDIYLFAGITGDFSVNHVNEQYMARSKFGRRIAHGALIIGYMSTCSTMMIDKCQGTARGETPVSLGYDRIRFLGPVFIGDTVTVTYTIAEIDPQKRQSLADIGVTNQDGTLVTVARHILRWVNNAS